MNNVGKKLKLYRKQTGMTVSSVAETLKTFGIDLTASAIYRYEEEKTFPSLNTLHALTSIYGISISSFIDSNKTRQALTASEMRFILALRHSDNYKKIIACIVKNDREEIKSGKQFIF